MAAVPAETSLVVIGASAGGVPTLLELAEALPAGFPAPICVVQHVGTNASMLPELLSARGPHPAVHAHDRQLLTPGVIHVAPPDHHMLVEGNSLRLLRGPRENHCRPAIDPLFRSAALEWGARTIGVVLTGMLDDGTAGLKAVKERGGIAVVEDPLTAYEPSMPRSALQNVQVDHCVPVVEMGPLLGQLVGLPPPASQPRPGETLVREVAINRGQASIENLEAIAGASTLTCPDCGGTLWEVNDPQPLRYRCHTGHAYTARTLAHSQDEVVEDALRASVRALAEREMLLRRTAAIAAATGDTQQAEAGVHEADRLRRQVDALRRLTESERARLGGDVPP